jgi:hypothetical protein
MKNSKTKIKLAAMLFALVVSVVSVAGCWPFYFTDR